MIYFLATLISCVFALSLLCIFGIISGITGLKELEANSNPHWGLSLTQLKNKFLIQSRINDLAWMLAVNVVFLVFLSLAAYHLIKGPTL